MWGELALAAPLTLSTSFSGRCSAGVDVKLWLLSSPASECFLSFCFLCFFELPILARALPVGRASLAAFSSR